MKGGGPERNNPREKQVQSIVRAAARVAAVDGWYPTPSGLVWRGSSGHWGRIRVRVGSTGAVEAFVGFFGSQVGPIEHLAAAAIVREPVRLVLDAGVASPYLLRVVNKLDPERRPPAGYEHAALLSSVELQFDPNAMREPAALAVPQPAMVETGIVLGPESAPRWLRDLFGTLVPLLTALGSDEAILDYLLEHAGDSDTRGLRDAALLARHLGLPSLPLIVERAAVAWARGQASLLTMHGRDFTNDRDPNILMWSHDRFLRFLDSAP